MNVENAILSFIFNICNWAFFPVYNTIQKDYPDMNNEKDIVFSDRAPCCKLDVHFLEKKPAAKRPCLINIHGGGLIIGDKKNSTNYCYQVAGESDTVVFNINYPLPSKEIPAMFENVDPVASHNEDWVFPMAIQSHFDAFRWVEAHADEYGIDLDNVFISGDSAGSEMTAMVMACFCNEEYAGALGVEKPNFVPKGYIMNCGLYNMNVYKYIPVGRVMWVKFMGDKAPHKNPMWKYHNPMPYLNGDIKNAMVVKGMTDVLTIFQSDWMVKRLKEVGVPTTYYIGKNPLNSFHDFILNAPSKDGKKAVAATRKFIAECVAK